MTDQPRYVDARERFRLDSRIATGGMGEVWRATDTTLDRPVAIKLLRVEYADDPTFRARFETEARHAAALHHPGVASIFDYGTTSDQFGGARPFLVMELVDGKALSTLLRPGHAMGPAVVQDLLGQAASALAAAHTAGIVHRDVKPANLLVTPDRTVKITDFGIARAVESASLTEVGQVMGTPHYLSPEQARGETATKASDVYSLGIVAFECLTGRRPFDAGSSVATALAHVSQPVPELPDSVPPALAAVVTRALAKDPIDRYADAAAFAAALRSASLDPDGPDSGSGSGGGPGGALGAGAMGAGGALAGGAAAGALAGGAADGAPPTAAIPAAGSATAAGSADSAPGDGSQTQVLPTTSGPAGTSSTSGTAGGMGGGASAPPATPGGSRRGDPEQGEDDRIPVWVWVLVVVGLAIVAWLLWMLLGGQGDPTDEPEQPPPSQTTEPTQEPTQEPTDGDPTEEPSQEPTSSPTPTPSETPTEEPTEEPSPSEEPSETLTDQPTEQPSTTESSAGQSTEGSTP